MKQNLYSSIKRIVSVNQAGELGAIRIYQTQYNVLKTLQNHKSREILKILSEEKRHFMFFKHIGHITKTRPTISDPLFAVGAYAIGGISALLGINKIRVCTMAVEDVIDKHYLEQLKELRSLRTQHVDECKIIHEMIMKIKKFRNDEIEHRDNAANQNGNLSMSDKIFYRVINLMTNIAIKIAKST